MKFSGFQHLEKAEDWKRWVRLHVEAVASEIAEQAARRAMNVLGKGSATTPLLESAIAVVSRYLISGQEPLWPGRTKTLLRVSFRRALRRHAAKLDRREVLGGTSDVEDEVLAFQNSGPNVGYYLNPETVVRLMGQKSRAMLTLRDAGYEWKEVGRFFGVSGSAAKKAFREELELAIQIADHPESRPAEEKASRAEKDRTSSGVRPLAKPLWD